MASFRPWPWKRRPEDTPPRAAPQGPDIEALYLQHKDQVFRAIAGIVLDRAAAEDLTQETFERAFRARRSYRGDPNAAGAWVYRIAVNLAVSWLRRQGLARLLPMRLAPTDNPGREAFAQVEAREAAVTALSALMPRQRAVVVLTYYNQLTQPEIAEVLGIPRGTVATRLAAARERMRAALERPGPSERP